MSEPQGVKTELVSDTATNSKTECGAIVFYDAQDLRPIEVQRLSVSMSNPRPHPISGGTSIRQPEDTRTSVFSTAGDSAPYVVIFHHKYTDSWPSMEYTVQDCYTQVNVYLEEEAGDKLTFRHWLARDGRLAKRINQ